VDAVPRPLVGQELEDFKPGKKATHSGGEGLEKNKLKGVPEKAVDGH
jgi:hypothetical protein